MAYQRLSQVMQAGVAQCDMRRWLPKYSLRPPSAMGTLHPEMEGAVPILGLGRLGTIARIAMPLLKRPLMGDG